MQRRQAGVGRNAREQDPAEEVVLARPADLLDRGGHVVEEDLRHARASPGHVVAEVDHPPVVGLEPRPPQLEVFRRREARGEVAAREERRHRVGEQHLRDHTVVLELLTAALRVPVAVRELPAQVGERVHVRLRPRVELVEVLLLEVLAVLGHLGTGVPVGRDHDVAVTGELCRLCHLRTPKSQVDARHPHADISALLIAERTESNPAPGT